MISIVSLEIQKILKRKFILILLAIYSAILLFMAVCRTSGPLYTDSDVGWEGAGRNGSCAV